MHVHQVTPASQNWCYLLTTSQPLAKRMLQIFQSLCLATCCSFKQRVCVTSGLLKRDDVGGHDVALAFCQCLYEALEAISD